VKFNNISIMAIFVLLVCPATANAVYREVLEEHVTYEAVKGDYIEKIAGITGVEVKYLLEQNPEYKRKKFLHPGDRFSVVRRTIVPDKVRDGTLINIPDRTLYQFKAGNLVAHYPVGVGMRNRIWQTPVGEFVVVGKKKNPTWHVPKLIQKEMARKSEPVKDIVPPGKDNPLGRFEVRLSVREYLIHETIWPESIYKYRSHGCIRLKPGDAEKYFNSVTRGERVTVIYEPVKVAVTDSGRVFLEVHEDAYGKVGDLYGIASADIAGADASDRVDWDKVKAVVGRKSGIAEDITKENGR
jgi:L,D-transpeptidase ErfK/SrfK